LEPGEYDLQAEMDRFRTRVQRGVLVTIGGEIVVDLALSIGAVTEEVDVEEPLLERAPLGINRVVGTREIERLPNLGRNFVEFVKLSSGVVLGRENVGGGIFKEPDAGAGAAAVPRLSFGGQSELNTLIQVDGVDNIQTVTGLPRATPSQEAVREFRVLNSSYPAEYGRALGGVVNIVTKSGANQAAGSFYYYGMNQVLNANPTLSPPDAAMRQHQFGLTFGGPLRKNRSFVFANYEGQRREEANKFSQVILNNLAGINATRARFGLTPEVTNLLRSSDYDQFLVRLDQRLGGQNSLTLRYNLQDAAVRGFLGGGGRASAASSTARNSDSQDQALVLSGIAVLSERAVSEVRIQWARRSFDFESVLNEPALEIPNLIIMGKSTSDMDFYREDRLQVTSSLSLVSGPHQLKAGFDYSHLGDQTVWELFFPARVIFPSLQAFLAFGPTSPSGPVVFWWPQLASVPSHPGFSVPFTRAVPVDWEPATRLDLEHDSFGVFAQDLWRIDARWTLSYGLRYDFETYPSRYIARKDLNNLQPRLGLAYLYSPKGIVRAGFGLFHDRIAASVGQILAAAEWNSRGASPDAAALFPGIAAFEGRFLQETVRGALAPPATVTFLTSGEVPDAGIHSLTANMSSLLENPYSVQASVQADQELGGGMAVSASYVFVHGVKLPAFSPNLNAVQTGTLGTGKPLLAGRRYPELGDFLVIANLAGSLYHGGTIEVRKRFGDGLGFRSSYTFATARNDADSISNLQDVPEGATFERARSRQSLAHRGTLSILAEAPRSFGVLRGVKLSSELTLESGRYYSAFVGRDANGDGNPLSDRPGLLPRNSLKGPAFASWDLRVAREIRFNGRWSAEVSLDVFNALNRFNVKDLNTVYGGIDLQQAPNPLLGYLTPRDAFNPRQLQFGVRIRY